MGEGDDVRCPVCEEYRAYCECPKHRIVAEVNRLRRELDGGRLNEADRRAIALALSELAYARPGWADYLRRIACKLGIEGLYDGFRGIGPDGRGACPPPGGEAVRR